MRVVNVEEYQPEPRRHILFESATDAPPIGGEEGVRILIGMASDST
jgi:hypothetical protein